MKSWQPNIYLWLAASVVVIINTVVTQPAWAETQLENRDKLSQKAIDSLLQQIDSSALGDRLTKRGYQKIRQLSDLETSITIAQQLLVQLPTPQTIPAPTITQITGVKANPTQKGVEVILQTTQGEKLQLINRSAGNNFVTDIPNTQLSLPSGEGFTFRSEKPLTGIIEITVTNIDANTVRVTVVGEKALPTVELFDDNAGLVFAVASAATATQPPQQLQTPEDQQKPASETPQDEPIELVVTGEQDTYNVPDSSTATKTDTPLRDIPQSIQVVPRQVLEDRKVRSLKEAVETVSGVVDAGTNFGAPSGGRIIRGFVQTGNFRNGYRDTNDSFTLTGIGTIEQVDVLKGPASVLFGAVEPGGIVNVITKQPLSEPYYSLGFEAGNFGYYQPSIDFSGPLNAEKTVLYRFIATYQNSEGFQDSVNSNITTIAPSITLKLGDRTDLNLYYEYTNYNGYPNLSGSWFFSDGSFLPRSLFLGYPDSNLNFIDATTQKFGYTLSHKFSNNWQIRNNLAVATTRTRDGFTSGTNVVDDSFLVGIDTQKREYTIDNYFGQIDLLGKFKTGSISHQLLAGFDFNRNLQTFEALVADPALPDLDIFNPDYNISNPVYIPNYSFDSSTQSYGAYLQDQISILDNLKLLVGGRLDWVSQNVTNSGIDSPEQNDSAFSPRVGLVYQPSKSVSLYTSYSQSFLPTSGFNPDGRAFKPTKGTQYEAGIKTDFLDGKLSTTLAVYQITKTNVTIQNDRDSQIQVGEQRSRGIELDIAGEILPGWKVIGSYAYTDAEVTEDIDISVGNKLLGVPENQASLWTTYEIQKGDLKGLGFGLGLFYVGERAALSDNSVELPNYLRTDAAIFYRRDRFNAAINIRNLFDTDYFSSTYGYTLGLERGAPLTIIGSIRWEL
ncbi:TonB-dependent siderophore receptor [Nostoc sp. LPT]|uniref:TonB-dependent siderophore receptor n=1 Tax=Nostoc sp. LPT TaxID=2815387 RepID=UPI001D461605|nr:TonB-dependent siderophore receptor [Nostoc sp. LPT]MBN4006364.1 TonB-dependent siderophore receptor [Nostoc sp. LPT]